MYRALFNGILMQILCELLAKICLYRNTCAKHFKLEFVFYVKTDVSPLSKCMSKICKQEL